MRKALFICRITVCVLFIITGFAMTSEPETRIVRNTKSISQKDPVYFTEDSSFAVSDFLNHSLGIKKIVIQKGDYVIDFTENPNGRIEFRMDEEESDLEEIDGGPIFGVSVAIRIARRKSKHYPCNCCSGIGFRCGFVSVNSRVDTYSEFERSNTDRRNKYATVSFNKVSRTIRLDFMQNIDWQEMEK
jgi:hypothetical protein